LITQTSFKGPEIILAGPLSCHRQGGLLLDWGWVGNNSFSLSKTMLWYIQKGEVSNFVTGRSQELRLTYP
jgi:hypothetical protein